ncbi:zf-TFIIB domain-containing protein [Candidatus Thiodiazotropha sp. LNASS1]|uniref:TFIIB-type zinc ribbon-containing protein n=1 Tax=Candidatus Thiodiazotropha sp. LNASS1 TaxID=3096260 RepID=UPI0034DF203C
MDCPRCIEKMEETTSKGIITHTCFYCNGTWINSEWRFRIISAIGRREASW